MIRFLFPAPLLIALTTFTFIGCGTSRGPETELPPQQPRVQMPSDLNSNEERYISQVEEVLERNGLKPTLSSQSEYRLDFSLNDGPVNADAELELYRGREQTARSFARVGGPRIIFQRKRVVREAFEKAIADFEGQLSQSGSGGSGEWDRSSTTNSPYEESNGNDYDDSGYQGAPYTD